MNQNWLVSFDALNSIFSDSEYSNLAINNAIKKRPSCNGAFVRAMVKGVLRDKIKLDYYIGKVAANGVAGVKKRPILVLRMGFFAITSMDGVPDYAAVNEAVSLAKTVCKGNASFVNAVLRNFAKSKGLYSTIEVEDRNRELSLIYSFPEDLVELIVGQYGDSEGTEIIRGLYEPAALSIRANRLKTSRESLLNLLLDKGFEAFPDEFTESCIIVRGGDLIGSAEYEQGLFTVQSTSSVKAIEAFSPKTGSLILDMCASPGGKSTAMAELMGNKGAIVSCDIHEHRLKLIEKNAERLGIDVIRTRLTDGSEFDPGMSEKFDYVLADVPCSGLGVIPGKPEIKYRFDSKILPELIATQGAILENAIRYVKPGGLVMYSTCTINKNENSGVVDSLVPKFDMLEIVESTTILPYNNKAGFYYCIIKKNKTL